MSANSERRTRALARQLRLTVLAAMTLSASTAHGDDHEGDHDHDHEQDAGHAHSFEVGVAPGLVYVPSEGEFSFGLHLHAVGTIAESRWGVGGGVERLFDEHGHTTVSVLLQFRILEPWTVILAPGVAFSDGHAGVDPSVHIETAYEFMFGHFHVGPSLELAVDPDEVHLTLGVHTGVGF